MKEIFDRCSSVHLFITSKALHAEVATLDSILYVYHHQLCCHKPYLALKQVQQCTKRIRSMGLEDSLKELMELCPKKAELESSQYCTVPSQPILELVSMKILGSCKLLVRLMDCCCKAFHLCLQHLNLEEFIIINVVLLGLLSRLWVLYRGLLKRLIVLYSTHRSLQQEVSDFQKMPYFKDFVFPTNIEDHIGSIFGDLVARKLRNLFPKKGKKRFLDKIFDTINLDKEEKKKSKIGAVDLKETNGTLVDVGRPIQRQRFNRGKLDALDKALFLPVKASGVQKSVYNQDPAEKQKSNESKNKPDLSQHRRKKECVRHLVPKIKAAEDFKALSKQLLYAVKWCKARKLKTECVFFRNRYLRCNRLRHAEALGYSLKKKLQCWKKSMCHSLRWQTLNKDHLRRCLRIQGFLPAWKHVVTFSRRHRLQKSSITHSQAKTKDFKISPLCLDLFPDSALRPPTSELQESSISAKGIERSLTDTDDIDDIFSSIGI
ncbi:nucleolus and neural progenitor protein isoform X2 [Rhinoderma darwinii]